MTFSERMKGLLEQGASASKELVLKAGAKAQELGERGGLMLDMKLLENQAQKLISKLGAEVYQEFAEKGEPAVSAQLPAVQELLSQIAALRETIERKDAELRLRKGQAG
jgi:uncharacterized small protein (DUF1192 family)